MPVHPKSTFRPTLLFTCGDPGGIGPEVVLKAVGAAAVRRSCRPVLVGEASIWRRAGFRPGLAPIVDTRLGLKPPPYGRATRAGGLLSFAAFQRAVELAERGAAQGVVTAPIAKTSWGLAGLRYRDHTEFLRERFPDSDAQMVLGAPPERLWCALATRHVPLREVPEMLERGSILGAACALRLALERLGLRRPRIALCALNPHAGEEGLLGREERGLASAARKAGLSGPVAADTAWRLHRSGAFDGLVCLYHDQALIPLKTAAGLGVVNWTVGLPFIRTSPGHGTGFDIAGRKRADPSATIQAASLAASLACP